MRFQTLCALALAAATAGCAQSADDRLDATGGTSTGLTGLDSTGSSGDDSATTGAEKFDIPPADSDGNGGDNESGCQAVDLLFVIDSSGSMADEQENLIASFPGFIDGIQQKLKYQSYHVGILSTDEYSGNPMECQQLGALVTATTGENSSESTCGPFSQGNFMSKTDDFVTSFECAARLGTVGSGDEKPMEALTAALDPAASGLEACNDGFLRDNALLVVVIITDEEDDHEGQPCGNPFSGQEGSAGDPPDWYDAVVAAKGNPDEVVVLSLVGPPGPDPKICPTLDKCNDAIIGAEKALRIVEFTKMFNWGFVGRVCEDSYEGFFNAAIDNIVQACDEFPPEG